MFGITLSFKNEDAVTRQARILAQKAYRLSQESREWHFGIKDIPDIQNSNLQIEVIVRISHQTPNQHGEIFSGMVE